ncbi:MAG: hypothetical protein DMG64_13125 [Acidobacteria bacterium]|nr:MAG: hypothetical protein DMG64_13125 [Acidobacteriota bacterium]
MIGLLRIVGSGTVSLPLPLAFGIPVVQSFSAWQAKTHRSAKRKSPRKRNPKRWIAREQNELFRAEHKDGMQNLIESVRARNEDVNRAAFRVMR